MERNDKTWNDDPGSASAGEHHHIDSANEHIANEESGQKLIWGPVDGPLEAPAKVIEPGPWYKDVGEILPELSQRDNIVTEFSQTQNGPQNDSAILPVDRRDFMRLFSASAMLASASCVRRPVEKAIPYVTQPVDFVPGVAVNYASACRDCSAGCGIVVKTREGRPVKVEGHELNMFNKGGMCSLGQSTLQALYHPERRKSPAIRRGATLSDVSWDDFFTHLKSRLADVSKVAILTGPATGSQLPFYKEFLGKIGASPERLYVYDADVASEASCKAHELAFGVDGMPRVDFGAAAVVLGIGADFLELGRAHVNNAKGFAGFHSVKSGRRGKFIQLESRATLTGAKADDRHPIPVGSELSAVLLLIQELLAHPECRGSSSDRQVAQEILQQNSAALSQATAATGLSKELFMKFAQEMLENPGVILVSQSGGFDQNTTALHLCGVIANQLIGAYGKTLRLDEGHLPCDRSGAKNFADFAKDLGAGEIEALVIIDRNPAFDIPKSFGMADKIKGLKVVVSLQSQINESDEWATHVGNVNHFLENWGDSEPVAGVWTVQQPAIRPTTQSRQAEDVLLWLAAHLEKPMGYEDYRTYIMKRWAAVHQLVASAVPFDDFFREAQKKGFVSAPRARVVPAMRNVASSVKAMSSTGNGLKLLAHLDHRLLEGRGSNRPVLQEVGDGMTSIAWDSWVALNPKTAQRLGFKMNDVLLVETAAGSVKGALYPLPGLHPDAVVVPRGNGHGAAFGRVTMGYGFDPLNLVGNDVDALTGMYVTSGQAVKVSRAGEVYRLAAMQKSADIGNRKDIVRTVGIREAIEKEGQTKDLDAAPDLYPELPKGAYRWGMSIDLNQCTGCGACNVACSQENNIPQVGRQQVMIGREMHWIRLDRYFSGDPDNPEVIFQPMPCQHCNHAPCEAVCPVFATTHDPEGINSQTYNRCVGTRYCANACPYKVRRFNWFTYKWNMIGERECDRNPRALNPDVTVRTRGIMEKCTFCVQRLRDAKHKAKANGGKVVEGDVKTACQQVCPSDAIEFGDLFDPNSKISKNRKDYRSYLALGGFPEHQEYGLKTLPNVSYLMKVNLSLNMSMESHHE